MKKERNDFSAKARKHAAKAAKEMNGRVIASGTDKYVIEASLDMLIHQYMKSHRLGNAQQGSTPYNRIYATYCKNGDAYHIARHPQEYPHDDCTNWSALAHKTDTVQITWTAEDEKRLARCKHTKVAKPWRGEGIWQSARGFVHIAHTSKGVWKPQN